MTPDPSEFETEHREWLAQGRNDPRVGIDGDTYDADLEER